MKKVFIISVLALIVAGCQCNRQNENTPQVTSELGIGTTLEPAKQGGISHSDLKEKYAIIAGAYRHREYAERKVKELDQKGYPASIVSFRNGLMAVVICPSDELDATVKKLEELRGTDVCPQDGWILTLR